MALIDHKQLTEKQEAYCQAYMVCGNQSAAYRIAYDAESMNANSVAVEACRIHADPNVTLRIKQLRKEAYERNKMNTDDVLQALQEMVNFDIGELHDDEGRLLPLKQMPKHARQMIEGLDVEELYTVIDGNKEPIGQIKKVRLTKRIDAIEKYMRHLGLYEKDNTQLQPANNIVINLGGGVPEEGDR